jgi:Zn-dependent peptidase ImmA (M78 family)/transcriptional regulator with XRE-family HTH domain
MDTPQSQLPARLRAAREACGLTQADVAQQLGVTPAAISYLESGARRVASVQLAKLARLYGRDIADFLAEEFEPSTALRALFRTQLGQEARPELIQAGARCLELARAEFWLEARLGIARPARLGPSAAAPQPASETVLQSVLQGESMASAERQRLGLGTNPLGDFVELLEGQGVRTALLDLPPGVDGLTLTPPQLGAFLVVNRDQGHVRRRFSFAHEYAHVLLDAPSNGMVSWSGNRRDLKETRAHAFAAAFLMPAEGVRGYIASLGRQPRQSQTEVFDGDRVAEFRHRADRGASQVQPADVVHLARHFGVSPLAAIYRLRNLGMLTPTERDALVELDQRGSLAQLSKLLGFSEPAIGRDDPQVSQHRFLALVTEALRRSEISWGRALEFAQLTDMSAARFEQLAEAMHIQSEPPDAVLPADLV